MAIELEKIKPWDGQSGTGADNRGVIDRNFEKVKTELEAIDAHVNTKFDDVEEEIVQLAGEKLDNLLFRKGTFSLGAKSTLKEVWLPDKDRFDNLYIRRMSNVQSESSIYIQLSTVIEGIETTVYGTQVSYEGMSGIVEKTINPSIGGYSPCKLLINVDAPIYGVFVNDSTSLEERELDLDYVKEIDGGKYFLKAEEGSILTPRLSSARIDRSIGIHKAFKKFSFDHKIVGSSKRLYIDSLSLTASRALNIRIREISGDLHLYTGKEIPTEGVVEVPLFIYGGSENAGYVIIDASQLKDEGVTYLSESPADPFDREILHWSIYNVEEQEEEFELSLETILHNAGIIDKQKTIADNSSYTIDGYYLMSNGSRIVSESYHITDWIPVKPKTRYKWTGRLSHARVCVGANFSLGNIRAIVNADESGTVVTEEIFTTPEDMYYVRLCTHKTVDSKLEEVDVHINKSGQPEYDTIDEMIDGYDGRKYAKVGAVSFEAMTDNPTGIKDYRTVNGEKRLVENRWILQEVRSMYHTDNSQSRVFTCIDGEDNLISGTRLTTQGNCYLYKNDESLFDFGAGKKVYDAQSLPNGEYLVIIEDDNAQQSVWVSSAKGSIFEQKFLTSYIDSSSRGRIEKGWGVDVYDNIILVSEYGSHGVSKYVWMSEDYGETFKVLLNVNEDNLSDGSPICVRLDRSHVHGCFFDPYWQRVWVIYADNDNSSILFTDDWRESSPSWERISINTVKWGGCQTVCGKAFPDFILLGSDANYCGVYRLNRTSKKNDLKIEFVHDVMNEGDWELAQISEYSRKTYVGGNVYQRNYEQPIFLSFHRHSHLEEWANPNLVATYDGINFTNIFQFGTDVEVRTEWGCIINSDSKENLYIRPSGRSGSLVILKKV